MEFNPDGSLRRTAGQVQQDESEKRSLVITREQLSEKPAKAQIRIRFPVEVKNPEEVIRFYDTIDSGQFRSVDHELKQIDERTFVVRVDRGSMLMYGLLNFMVECFRDKYGQGLRYGQTAIVKGRWTVFS